MEIIYASNFGRKRSSGTENVLLSTQETIIKRMLERNKVECWNWILLAQSTMANYNKKEYEHSVS